MRAKTLRRAISTGIAATGAVLVAASVAYACTTYRGMMTVTLAPGVNAAGTPTPGGVSRMFGKETNHGFCGLGDTSYGPMAIAPQGGSVSLTIEVAPSPICASATNVLATGGYDAQFLNGAYFPAHPATTSWASAWNSALAKCGPATVGSASWSAANVLTVVAGGTGSTTVPLTIPATATGTANSLTAGDASVLCIYQNGGNNFSDGNAVPITVL